MQTTKTAKNDSTMNASSKKESQQATTHVPITEREAQVASVFESCIPGGMMLSTNMDPSSKNQS